jgi:DNA-binding NtrC family response regulator
MAKHVLQVAYYPTLLETRARMLESAGYHVTSVLGNHEAMKLDRAVITSVDLFVVGFSCPHIVRTAMVQWFKEHYPKIPIVALRLHPWETFPEAAAATLSEDPADWIAIISQTLKSSAASA